MLFHDNMGGRCWAFPRVSVYLTDYSCVSRPHSAHSSEGRPSSSAISLSLLEAFFCVETSNARRKLSTVYLFSTVNISPLEPPTVQMADSYT